MSIENSRGGPPPRFYVDPQILTFAEYHESRIDKDLKGDPCTHAAEYIEARHGSQDDPMKGLLQDTLNGAAPEVADLIKRVFGSNANGKLKDIEDAFRLCGDDLTAEQFEKLQDMEVEALKEQSQHPDYEAEEQDINSTDYTPEEKEWLGEVEPSSDQDRDDRDWQLPMGVIGGAADAIGKLWRWSRMFSPTH